MAAGARLRARAASKRASSGTSKASRTHCPAYSGSVVFEGAEVLVPNGLLISEKVTNWTLSDRHRRVEVDVGVSTERLPGA